MYKSHKSEEEVDKASGEVRSSQNLLFPAAGFQASTGFQGGWKGLARSDTILPVE